jgi:hypothetical protein
LAGFAPAFLEEGNEWRGVVLLTLPLSFFIVLRLLKLKAVQSWRRSIPVGIETIGGLATAVAALNDDRLSALREKDIELAREKIRTIVSAQLGVPLELVRPEAELIRDLGMD